MLGPLKLSSTRFDFRANGEPYRGNARMTKQNYVSDIFMSFTPLCIHMGKNILKHLENSASYFGWI